LTYTVQAFDYDNNTGDITRGRTAIIVPHEVGLPDGMTIDDEGMLWMTHSGGGSVCRWNPETSVLLDQSGLPTPQITACEFGGKDLATLFITSAKIGLDDEALQYEPHAGGLFLTEARCARHRLSNLLVDFTTRGTLADHAVIRTTAATMSSALGSHRS
jgi:sugar lactone lactonase YvrE